MSEKFNLKKIEKPAETANLQSLELKANLNPEQRTYLEKLKARAGKILGNKTVEDLEKAKDIKSLKKYKEILQEILEFLKTKVMKGVIEGKTPEGKKVKFELQEQLESWRDFYKKHNVDWAPLPEDISVTKEQAKEMRRLIKELGFDKMIIIPENLVNTGEKYEKLNTLMSKGYNETYQEEDFIEQGGFDGLKNKSEKLKIILTKVVQNLEDDELFKETLGESVNDLEEEGGIFETKGVRGLDLGTYLVWQREYFEKTGQHLDEKKRTLLTEEGSRPNPPNHGYVPHAFWWPDPLLRPGVGRLSFFSYTLGSCFDGLGCRLAGTFEIEE